MPATCLTLALGAAIALTSPVTAAADNPGTMDPEALGDHQALGAYASNIAGSGLTYSRHFAGGLGYHISAIGWGQAGSAFVNAGAALTKDFDRRSWGSVYGLMAVGLGLSTFSGGGGLAAANALQLDAAPGVGVSWGPFNLELGYSIYTNPTGIGFQPAGGVGANWWF